MSAEGSGRDHHRQHRTFELSMPIVVTGAGGRGLAAAV
jgi:hypothetical protein